MEDESQKRRRHTFLRLHAISWLVLLATLVVTGFAQRNMHGAPGGWGSLYNWFTTTSHGWPSPMIERTVNTTVVGVANGRSITREDVSLDWISSGVRINAAICLSIVASTVLLVERRMRAEAMLQFRLSAIMTFTAAVAISLAITSLHGPPPFDRGLGILPAKGFGLFEQSDWFNWYLPAHLQFPLFVGLICTVYVLLSLPLYLLRRRRQNEDETLAPNEAPRVDADYNSIEASQ